MFITNNSIFQNSQEFIADDANIVFVSDYFIDEYVGGAELTTQALIDSYPASFKISKIKSSNLTLNLLEKHHTKFFVFCNWSNINPNLIPSIIANLKYVVIEYDYKYCQYRSPQKHFFEQKIPCDCHNQNQGKMVSAFYYGAEALFWMSKNQMEKYHTLFPFLVEKNNIVLSSVFDAKTLIKINELRNNTKIKNDNWIILGSNSWVKGFTNAKNYVEKHQLSYEIVWNVPYEQLLEKLAVSKGLVYLPEGDDTCPRLCIEAKLLNCDLVINDYVQHKNEEWFNEKSCKEINDYLTSRPQVFWSSIEGILNHSPTISGYTTTFNCIKQGYPYIESIKSLLSVSSEVCVVDGGSDDGTWESLLELQKVDSKLKLKQITRDWNNPRFALYDGMQKAEARKMCTGDYCWQMDVDEIIHEQHVSKVKDLCKMMPKYIDIMCLPVIEFWGKEGKVRIDVTPWKWRFSRNKKNITHGIPKQLRQYDENGELYALPGTDGCDMIFEDSGEIVPSVNFWNNQFETFRQNVLSNANSIKDYEHLMNQIYGMLPCVFHYSWWDIERKIKTYQKYWQKHWQSLYNQVIVDNAKNNMFFNVSWSEVTDEMIKEKAQELSINTAGHIFHTKWLNLSSQQRPHIILTNLTHPQIMENFLKV